ncbi:WXG100 family type VII secretion target [Amycolatopsis sp. cg5]|uniref:WXG100 family type VII secretion target n=1 Tax=Amycolatopsis sp. cg5 TaxID=3238802 RepID=UPI003524F52C
MPNGGGTGGSGGFTADPDAVLVAAKGFLNAADQLEEATKALQSALAAQGACWGDDESGKEFAKDYVPGAEGGVEGFGSLVQGLRGMHQNVDTAMRTITGAEDIAQTAFKKGR